MFLVYLVCTLSALLVGCLGADEVAGGSDTETLIVPAKHIQGYVANSDSLGLAGWEVQAIEVGYVPFEVSQDSTTLRDIQQVQTGDSGFFDFADLKEDAYYHLLVIDSIAGQVSWVDSVLVGSLVRTSLTQGRAINISKEFKPYDDPNNELYVYFPGSPFIQFCSGESTDIQFIPDEWIQLMYFRGQSLVDSIPLSEDALDQDFYIDELDRWSEL